MPELHHFEYQLKAGQYHLYDLRDAPSVVTGERRWRLQVDAVALAFDETTGEVLEHGRPERVWSWAATRRRQMRMARQWERAAALIVISGPFPIPDLNRCLREAGYVAKLFKRLATLPNGKSSFIRPPSSAQSATRGATYGSAYGSTAGRTSGYTSAKSSNKSNNKPPYPSSYQSPPQSRSTWQQHFYSAAAAA